MSPSWVPKLDPLGSHFWVPHWAQVLGPNWKPKANVSGGIGGGDPKDAGGPGGAVPKDAWLTSHEIRVLTQETTISQNLSTIHHT